tara:strand:+ start:112 stop:1173 length:1062 start_codon:yes stop_codon:yes gene_type:complete
MQIMGIGHYEVKTHSPILAELLNPKGSHGQGTAFLDRFVKQLGLTSFDTKSATVQMEYHAGQKTETTGGRIDILIRNNKGVGIVIENKIYAEEQDNQILRYHNEFPKAQILFLTLDGAAPHSAEGTPPEMLQCISYGSHIITWLEACRKEAATVPIVRESITQYINLIKDLTHQNTNSRMSHKITDAALKDTDSLQAFFALRNAESDLKQCILETLYDRLDKLAKDADLIFNKPDPDFGNKETGFYFTSESWPKSLSIYFDFENHNFRDLTFGLCDEGKDKDTRKRLREGFNEAYGSSHDSETWAAWIYWEKYRKWNDDTFEAIQFGSFVDDLKCKVVKMADIINAALGLKES